MDVKALKTATSSTTIEHLRSLFATHGLPELLVSDNGTVFTSSEFKDFLKLNGIRHTTCAPYHPATNGLAERAVQTFKEFIKKPSNHSLQTNISHFLFQYRITPHSTTGISPAELLLGRRPRSLLDLAIPSVSSRVTANQEKQKQSHEKSSKGRSFKVGDLVYIRDFPSGKPWLPGVIESACGPLTYWIKLSDGRSFRRHIDHIRSRFASAIELSTPQIGWNFQQPPIPPHLSLVNRQIHLYLSGVPLVFLFPLIVWNLRSSEPCLLLKGRNIIT